jgi:hypothetical protein
MHIWLNFFPHYTAEAWLKAATALASVTTAGAVIALLPDIKRLPRVPDESAVTWT